MSVTRRSAVIGVVAASAFVVGLTQPTIQLSDLQPLGVKMDAVPYQGRDAIRLVESDGSRQGGLAVFAGRRFQDGVIELEVAGKRGVHAVPDDRGFIGVAFRVRDGGSRYEYIYLRPDNGRSADQVRRNHATQYASHPEFGFDRLRKESPERYESYVDLEAGAWTRMQVEVQGTTARLYVHDAPQPALVVNDLKLGADGGGLALWIGPGTEGYFANFRVK